MTAAVLHPVALRKEGDVKLLIDWSDGHCSEFLWTHLRANCPCAACREQQLQPADPFRILKSSEIAPLRPIAIEPVGYYAYKIVWSDGHDSGLFTLEQLRALCQCPQCAKK